MFISPLSTGTYTASVFWQLSVFHCADAFHSFEYIPRSRINGLHGRFSLRSEALLDIVCQALPTASKGGEHGQRGRKAPGRLGGRERDTLTLAVDRGRFTGLCPQGSCVSRASLQVQNELERTMPRMLADTGKGDPHAFGSC